MEERIKKIQDSINNIWLYSDENAKKYISLLKEAVDAIEKIEAEPGSMLEAWKNQALVEISFELENRVNEQFFSSDIERKKSEFKCSRSLVSLALSDTFISN